MSVLYAGKRWIGGSIPYVVDPPNETLESWLQNINLTVKRQVLVRRTAEVDYLSVSHGGGNSEEIGRKGGRQAVTGSTEFVIHHEILHAIGFAHEQLHRDFPWDDTDPDLDRTTLLNDLRYSFNRGKVRRVQNPKTLEYSVVKGQRLRMKQEWNLELYKQIVQTVHEQYADSNLRMRFLTVTDPDVTHLNRCDFDSVMMYIPMREVVENVSPRVPFGGGAYTMRRSGFPPESRTLSSDDVAGILHLYPNLPPLAPRMRAPVSRTFPTQHNLFDPHSNLPGRAPAATVSAQPRFSFAARFQAAVKTRERIARSSGMRVFILGPTWREVEAIGIDVLPLTERFVSTGLHLTITPLVHPGPSEARLYFY
jgi:hypothetical protein